MSERAITHRGVPDEPDAGLLLCPAHADMHRARDTQLGAAPEPEVLR